MTKRLPYRAGSFYPQSETECRELLKQCFAALPQTKLSLKPTGGIVPHAGWVFSGPTAASVYRQFLSITPETFLIFGAVHVGGVRKSAIFPEGSWLTPLGEMEIDAELNDRIIGAADGLAPVNSPAHQTEHSIEVQLPFIQYLFPKAKFSAIMVPPGGEAHLLGRKIGELIKKSGRAIAVLGSTDLTHYGEMNFGFAPKGSGPQALSWVKDTNDRQMIDKIIHIKDDEIVEEAFAHYNACGAGAIAAALGCAKSLGIKEAKLLHYTTSYDVMPERRPTDFVGYAGIIF